MDKLETAFNQFPISERTLIKHKFTVAGHYKAVNDLGFACEYRVVDSDFKVLGVISYHRGRKLTFYELKMKA